MSHSRHIKNLSIQNFKAFGDMVDIPIRPITLIFGENSSGKSSILHSLLFLNQMQHQPQDKLADITYTKAGGNSVDLGGLPQLKYGKNDERALSFLVNSISSNHRMNLWPVWSLNISFKFVFSKSDQLSEIELLVNHQSICKFKELDYESENIELEINLDNTLQLLQNTTVLKDAERWRIDIPTDFMEVLPNYFANYTNQNTIIKAKIELPGITSDDEYGNNIVSILSKYTRGKVELLGASFCSIYSANNNNLNRILFDYDKLDQDEVIELDIKNRPVHILVDLLKIFFWREFSDTQNSISQNFSYLGPLRTIPTRNFDTLDSISRDPSTGSMAWEVLTKDEYTREQVNQWLARFGTNKQIVTEQLIDSAQLRQIIDQSTNLEEILPAINTLSKRNMLRFYDVNKHIYLSHRDLGVGISQILPVIVNSFAEQETMVLIEQPELHLHPRLQGDLADLFIETAGTGSGIWSGNTYVIETHSEHIIRRVMRRIREEHRKEKESIRIIEQGDDSDNSGDYYIPMITKDDVAILYVAAGPNGSTVTHLRLDDEGDLIDEWPNGFFEESFRDNMAGR